MSKAALFDDAGKCIGIFTGDQDLSVLNYAYAAEITGQMTPNEAVYNISTDTVVQQPYTVERPPRTEPTLVEQVTQLQQEVVRLREDNNLL